jgi:hypothetical protein
MKKIIVSALITIGFVIAPLTAWAGDAASTLVTPATTVGYSSGQLKLPEKAYSIKVVNLVTHKSVLMSGVTVGRVPVSFCSEHNIGYINSSKEGKNNNASLETSFVSEGFSFTIKPHKDGIIQLAGIASHLNSMKMVKVDSYKVQKPNVSTVSFSDAMVVHVGQTVKLRNGKYLVLVTRKNTSL